MRPRLVEHFFGKQTHAYTPDDRNKAWQYEVLQSTTAGEAAELHKANGSLAAKLKKVWA
jgi:hypothetical protein